MSLELFLRLMGMTVLAGIGASLGADMAEAINLPSDSSTMLFFLAGASTGLIVTPWITTRPAKVIRSLMMDSTAEQLLTSMVGLLFGLIVAALLAYPLSLLPKPSSEYLPTVLAISAAYLSALLFGIRAPDIIGVIQNISEGNIASRNLVIEEILLDTSVIIDGRILDIAKTGFVRNKLVIPQFVIRELQQLADSSDMQYRRRGRHGLDILNKLRQESRVMIEVTDEIPSEGKGVDEMLVALAQERGNLAIMTHDQPLNKIANIRDLEVLNVNDLAMALRPIYLPEETINLHIVQEGKEDLQGIGYLVDGTMVVVEGGRAYRDRTIPVVITRYIISSGGKMYFAQPAQK